MNELLALFTIGGAIEGVKIFFVFVLGRTKFWWAATIPVFVYDAIPRIADFDQQLVASGAGQSISLALSAWHAIGGTIYAIYSVLLYSYAKFKSAAFVFGTCVAVMLSLAYSSNWILFQNGFLAFVSNWIPSTAGGLLLLAYLQTEKRIHSARGTKAV